ncbi:MAG: hypothetical protein RLZ61_1777 [Planctomycetota bacterium]|jgi:hypothetical protein
MIWHGDELEGMPNEAGIKDHHAGECLIEFGKH